MLIRLLIARFERSVGLVDARFAGLSLMRSAAGHAFLIEILPEAVDAWCDLHQICGAKLVHCPCSWVLGANVTQKISAFLVVTYRGARRVRQTFSAVHGHWDEH